ncbi:MULTISPECIES: universal stress protein [Vibrio]|uniref:Universal stress protein n=1 Tax=Vibrio paracholerae TaxID=650003 RepID=A0ABD7FVL2_9VIBR|nr:MULTISPECIES: universal stress protein [Vibrio]RBM67974.1 universal stress protein [Vibrio paracholerae]TXX47734.1 universal stress protein [Vibrio cholerae]
MKKFKNILFATQGLPGHSDALEQAIQLAHSNRGQLAGLIAFPAFPDNLQRYQEPYEQSYLNSLMETADACRLQHHINKDEIPFPLTVEHSEQPAVAIIKSVLSHNIHLLIKEAEPMTHNQQGFKALDMTLLRKCPCPVWLHRPLAKPKANRRVAVAIDPVTTTEQRKAIALRLLELSRSIANTCDSRLHIVSCWEYYLENYLHDQVWIQVEQEQIAEEIAQAKIRHEKALRQLIDESGITGELVIHHLHGKPDELIPEWVTAENIDILVMGTLARTGIAGFVIGNTAENIVQSIECSLVALKPEGFVSPIKNE